MKALDRFLQRWRIGKALPFIRRDDRLLDVGCYDRSLIDRALPRIASAVGIDSLEIADPLSPNRKAGKVYIYAEGGGWAVSGHYRRNENDRWHPYLMTLNAGQRLISLKLKDRDPALLERAALDPLLEISP